MTDFRDDDIVRLRAALGRISRQLDRQISDGGMTRTQLSVLGVIGKRGPIRVSELAEFEGLNPTMLSRVLAKLEEMGLAKRTVDADDRRAVHVSVTSAGQRKHDRIRAERARLLHDYLERISASESARLLAALPALEHLSEVMMSGAVRA